MRHDFIDKYSHLDSAVQRLDPRAKILSALAGIVIVVTEPLSARLVHFVLYFSLMFCVLVISQLPPRYMLKRLLLVSPFIVMASIFYPLSFYITDKELYLTESRLVLNSALVIFLKALLSVLILIILTSTEKFHRLLLALRKLRFPKLICTISALLYRYIFIISDEMLRTTRARESRTPGTLAKGRIKVFGNQVAVIFLRSWERSTIIYKSMLSRGFTGEYPDIRKLELRPGDIVISASFLIAMLTIRFLDKIFSII